jgi:hypothetical protein
MASRTRIITRGEYVFGIVVAIERCDSCENITVSKDGQPVDSGRLELFSSEYLASRRYAQAFYKSLSKPVGRVGRLLIGPDAACAISDALRALREELYGTAN